VGWIYAANVVLTGGPLRVLEPPATSTPLATPTIDETLAAAFHVDPTQTRLPTFTPPPSHASPTFPASSGGREGPPTGLTIVGIGLVGAVLLAASFAGRRRDQ
jgi:MYXO-CTERM domain-containing protein